ncbi:MAG: glycerate kinase [Nitrospirae bacterium]|nr:glycerate kinase [Nitrospirota bacterium]
MRKVRSSLNLNLDLSLPRAAIRPLLKKLIVRGLDAVDARKAVGRAISRNGEELVIGRRRYDLRRYERVVVLGAGKATASMAQAIEQRLGPRLQGGFVVVKHGHGLPTKQIVVVEAGHPVPDRSGQRAAARLRAMATELGRHDLLIVLLSGGASSLLPAPVAGVTLADKQRTTQKLLRCGASIGDINTVRKHLSRIKGGRLAESTEATVVTVILSDVLGDDLSAIASGPTAPDPTTYQDAVAILKRYRIWQAVPQRVRRHLDRGCQGLVSETPKPGSPLFRRVHHHIIGNNVAAVTAVARAAREAGLRTLVLRSALTGEACEEGQRFGALAKNIVRKGKPLQRPCCVVAGGETTVTVTGKGTGGRAQEFSVAAALEIAGLTKVWVAAIGTDGTDGPTDAAGAVIDGKTLARAQGLSVDLKGALKCHNTYPALKQLHQLIVTGPTGTNVNDLYLLLVL